MDTTYIKYPFPLPAEGAATFMVEATGLAKAELVCAGAILSVLEFMPSENHEKHLLEFLGQGISFQCALCESACINIYIDSSYSKLPSLIIAEEQPQGDRSQIFTQEVAPRNSAGEITKKTLAYIDGRVGFIRRG